jgi:hypothetical protein
VLRVIFAAFHPVLNAYFLDKGKTKKITIRKQKGKWENKRRKRIRMILGKGGPSLVATQTTRTTGGQFEMKACPTVAGQRVRLTKYAQARPVEFSRKSLHRLHVVCGVHDCKQ